MKEMIISGMKVTVTKKKIKNMYLRVKPNGDVEVSAPYKMPEQSIVLFVNTKQAWIEKSIAKALSRSAFKREYTDGEKLFLFGREMTLRFDNGKNKGYCRNLQRSR